jgi:hypothetical protein
MISRKYLLAQTSLIALLLTGTLCASSTSTIFTQEAGEEKVSSRISQAESAQELQENTSSLTNLPPEVLLKIATESDKESWDTLKTTCITLNEICMDAHVLRSRGPTFVIRSADDLKEISERFYKDALCHVPIVFESYSPTDEDLQHLTNATQVDLSNCQGITDAGLAHLKNATQVNLSVCKRVTDAGLAHLKKATHVKFSFCPLITDAGLAHLTNATQVDLSYCRLITKAAKEALRQRGVIVIG